MNYLDILHHLVALYPDRLFNYNYSIRELGIGNYDHLWSVREDCALHEGTFMLFYSILVLQIMETQALLLFQLLIQIVGVKMHIN